MTKRLTLKSDTLTELTPHDLTEVVGGGHTYTQQGQTCPVMDCVSARIVGCANLTTGCTR